MTAAEGGGARDRDRPLVVVGDALLDRDLEGRSERLCPDAPVPVVEVRDERDRPGGAALAAMAAARLADRPVRLVTGLGGEHGQRVAELLQEEGVEVVDLGRLAPTPVKSRVRVEGHGLVRLDYDDGFAPLEHEEGVAEAIEDAEAVLVADYGRGVTQGAAVREALRGATRTTPIVWDPHPRGGPPVAGCRLATPNRGEASAAAGEAVSDPASAAKAAGSLLTAWDVAAVAITLGESGALWMDLSGTPRLVPATPAPNADACGAGDVFSAAVTAAVGDGRLLSEAVTFGVRQANGFVAAGGAAGWSAWHAGPAQPVRTVATGGCFDILHAGHVALLEQARRLGDRLVVLLNSDASVRRLKGPDRPLQPVADRERVLRSLAAVDDVVVFDEDTPDEALRRLRPAVFVKGGDYTIADLPEADLVARWGGTTLTLPYLQGRSTTRIIQEAHPRA